ncbi:MAG: hypothetical protein ACOYM2_12825 [Rectinemataceae bacterium]
MQTISSQLSSYSIYKNFHAVVVFNRKGDFFSSNFRGQMAVSVETGTIAGLPWIQRATEAAGRSVVVSPYEDAWRSKGRAGVYGRARVVPGIYDEPGFIEVQNRAEVLTTESGTLVTRKRISPCIGEAKCALAQPFFKTR